MTTAGRCRLEEGPLGLPGALLRRFPWLAEALAPCVVVVLENPFARPRAAAGWGRKPSYGWARHVARMRGLACWTLEDGFFRSVGLGKRDAPAWSLALDRTGIYFDGRTPSDMEALLRAGAQPQVLARGACLRDLIVRRRLTKYNHVPDRPVRFEVPAAARRILVVDQVAGDQSLRGAGADAGAFTAMLESARAAAREEGAAVVVKTHPDVAARLQRGMVTHVAGRGLILAPAEAHPHALFDAVDEVWTASSQLGFEALLRGLPTRCFAAPFYAGWGLTHDSPATPAAAAILARRAGTPVALDALAEAAIGRYPLYFDTERCRPVTAEEGLERLAVARDRAVG